MIGVDTIDQASEVLEGQQIVDVQRWQAVGIGVRGNVFGSTDTHEKPGRSVNLLDHHLNALVPQTVGIGEVAWRHAQVHLDVDPAALPRARLFRID